MEKLENFQKKVFTSIAGLIPGISKQKLKKPRPEDPNPQKKKGNESGIYFIGDGIIDN